MKSIKKQFEKKSYQNLKNKKAKKKKKTKHY
jgi:hypothetical protein